jgi:hypothetical protein
MRIAAKRVLSANLVEKRRYFNRYRRLYAVSRFERVVCRVLSVNLVGGCLGDSQHFDSMGGFPRTNVEFGGCKEKLNIYV